MTRDELILSCGDIVKLVLKKYNNNRCDEDLFSDGMLAVVECVNDCEKKNITDEKTIKKYCYVRVKSRILNILERKKLPMCRDNDVIDELGTLDDERECILNMKMSLDEDCADVIDYFMMGCDKDEIIEKMHIKKSKYYSIIKKIREFLEKQV